MKKLIKNILMSLITFLAVLIYCKIIFKGNSYNILVSFLYFVIFYFYSKKEYNFDKRTKKYALLLGLFVSLILSVGSIVSSYIYQSAINIFNIRNILYFVVAMLGFSFFFYRLFGIMFNKIKTINFLENHDKMTWRSFLVIFIIILVGYLLYYIRFYPALMTTDSYYVLHYANNFILSDFHSFGHTWFMGIFFHLGKILFGNMSMALGFAMFVQMVCMALIFTFAIYYLYNRGLKKKICLLLVLVYAFNPLHAYYSITLWRDIMFGGAFVLLFIAILDFLNCHSIKKRYIFLFIIGSLLMLFFRNNGIYIFIFMVPFILLILKKRRLLMSILCGGILVFYFVIKGPVFDYFNVAKTTSVEAFSIPLQQIARVIASGREIPDEDKAYLENLFTDYDQISNKYSSIISDPIKNLTNNDYLSNNKSQFLKTWLDLLIKYPNVYIEAYCLQTIGYWYPDIIYWATAGAKDNYIFESEPVLTDPLTPSWYNYIIDKTTSRNLPLSNLIWSVGLPFILLVISSFVLCYLKNKKYLLCFIPLYGLWLSIMVATPVFSELRYVYGLFTCLPLFIVLPFIVKPEKKRS